MTPDPRIASLDWKEIGLRLAAARTKARLYKKDVAKFLGMKPNNYAEYEFGRARFTVETMARICLILGISPDRLLGWQWLQELQERTGELATEELRTRPHPRDRR